MTKRVRPFVAVALLFIALGALYVSYERGSTQTRDMLGGHPTVLVGGERISVTVASTSEAREQGLSGTSSLSEGHGMLFVFPQDGLYRFWMKDMNYAIDIIWVRSDGRIVYIAPSLSPDTYPNSYGPDELSRYVLEVNADFSTVHNVQIGDQVDLSFLRLP